MSTDTAARLEAAEAERNFMNELLDEVKKNARSRAGLIKECGVQVWARSLIRKSALSPFALMLVAFTFDDLSEADLKFDVYAEIAGTEDISAYIKKAEWTALTIKKASKHLKQDVDEMINQLASSHR